MAQEIKTGIGLYLDDRYSAAIRKAGAESESFAGRTLGAVERVDKMLSGTAAKFAAFGLSFSLGAVSKEIIGLDHRMTRIGLTAGASAEQVLGLKRDIFKAAQEVKISPEPLVDAVAVIMKKTGDLKFARDNLLNIGRAAQVMDVDGKSLGNTFSALANIGFSGKDTLDFLDRAIKIGDFGGFGLGDFAKHAEEITSVYASVGRSVEAQAGAQKALQIIFAGVGNQDESVTAFSMMMTELRTKQDELARKGIRVKVEGTDRLRDFNDILMDIVSVIEKEGNSDYFYDVFGVRSARIFEAYREHGKRLLAEFDGMGDAAGELQRRVDAMAKTLYSNIEALKTSLFAFAFAGLTGPLAAVTEGLNKLTEHPERVKRLFSEIVMGIGAIAMVKGIAGAARVLESLRGFRGGSLNVTESLNMAGAMPVYVTNWGGAGFGGGVPGTGTGAPGVPGYGGGTGGGTRVPVPARGWTVESIQNAERSAMVFEQAFARRAALENAWKSAKGSALLAAIFAAVGLGVELEGIDKQKELSKEERAAAKGSAWGQSLGNVTGAGLGGFVGTLILPGVGTMIGAALLSQVFGALGRWGGEKLGGPVEEWKEGNAERTRQTGHYEFRGENGTPVWVEADGSASSPYGGGRWEPDENNVPKWVETVPEKSGMAWEKAWEKPGIPASVFPPGVQESVESVEALAAAMSQMKTEAELTGSVNVVIDVRDGRVETRARSDTSLVRPTVTNAGHTPDARDISP
jgi:hypothetical protein